MPVVRDEFLNLTASLVRSKIDILAHPFRVLNHANIKIPNSLFDAVIRLLKENDVAAEINFHTDSPSSEFFRRCLVAGIKLSLGSDAHNLYEIGEFTPHLALLRASGFDGDLNEILLNPELPAPCE
jgi:histidinol phosphatase-like PHP family hydrolase